MEIIHSTIKENFPSDESSTRLFHGRGNFYPGLESIVVDYFSPNLLITLYKEVSEDLLNSFISFPADNILVQKRYLARPELYALKGAIPEHAIAVEKNLKFNLKFGASQNIGFFLDMARGREWLINHSQDKKILNLFSYTCSLSVAALKGGADSVVNIDMSKAALSVGQDNHRLNQIDLTKVKFLSYDIMKSWNNIFRNGPYDIVVIDPPTNQGDSFKVERDYHKIVKRLKEMTDDNAIIMACLNSPHLTAQFLIDLFTEHAPEYKFQEIIYSAFSSMEKNPEEGLKIVLFKKLS